MMLFSVTPTHIISHTLFFSSNHPHLHFAVFTPYCSNLQLEEDSLVRFLPDNIWIMNPRIQTQASQHESLSHSAKQKQLEKNRIGHTQVEDLLSDEYCSPSEFDSQKNPQIAPDVHIEDVKLSDEWKEVLESIDKDVTSTPQLNYPECGWSIWRRIHSYRVLW